MSFGGRLRRRQRQRRCHCVNKWGLSSRLGVIKGDKRYLFDTFRKEPSYASAQIIVNTQQMRPLKCLTTGARQVYYREYNIYSTGVRSIVEAQEVKSKYISI